MFDKNTSVNTESFNYMSMVKTKSDSFFVYALKDRFLSNDSWSKEGQAKLDEENKQNREKRNAVSLNNLLGNHPNIEGREVEVLQLLILNKYATEAMAEVRYI